MADTLLIQLLDKYITHSISSGERQQLYQLLQSPEYNTELETIIDDQFQAATFELPEDDELRQIIFQKIQQKKNQQAQVKKMLWFVSSRTIRRMAVAASILLVVGLGTYFLFFSKEKKQTAIAKTQLQRFKNDIAPGKEGAILTLADGRQIVLDSAGNGKLAQQGDINVIKQNGQLTYNGDASTNKEVLYNTMTTPRGRKYELVLADGTIVTLDAATTIRYPTAFTGNERRVEINGQAYFKVTHDASKPFIVQKNDMAVQVYGTEFNVNAYDDESDIKVTLLEGLVKVNNATASAILKPSQQAVLTHDSRLTTHDSPDLEEVMAWKNGRFLFKSTDIKSLMRQLSRWYDVEVNYEDVPATGFNAKISREIPLNSVLKALELTGEVKFIIEGKKVTVLK